MDEAPKFSIAGVGTPNSTARIERGVQRYLNLVPEISEPDLNGSVVGKVVECNRSGKSYTQERAYFVDERGKKQQIKKQYVANLFGFMATSMSEISGPQGKKWREDGELPMVRPGMRGRDVFGPSDWAHAYEEPRVDTTYPKTADAPSAEASPVIETEEGRFSNIFKRAKDALSNIGNKAKSEEKDSFIDKVRQNKRKVIASAVIGSMLLLGAFGDSSDVRVDQTPQGATVATVPSNQVSTETSTTIETQTPTTSAPKTAVPEWAANYTEGYIAFHDAGAPDETIEYMFTHVEQTQQFFDWIVTYRAENPSLTDTQIAANWDAYFSKTLPATS